MENYIVSARKYRPSSFATVVGQKTLTTTLKNAIKSKQLAHAYLFCGPRGVGKTTCARIFAKTINCQNLNADFEACNECESCRSFNDQRSFNIHELDAASNNSVDGIRTLIEQVRIPPQIGKYSVYIVDEVHMLSSGAFNAFLKTLEEPPAHAIFILATTEKHKILPTILSRCQIYDFSRITTKDTVEHLQYIAQKEGISASAEALNVIAQKSDGGMRDALSTFDQLVSFCGTNITYENTIQTLNVLDYEYYFKLVDSFIKTNVAQSLLIFNDILSNGFDAQYFIIGLGSHLRDVLVSNNPETTILLEVSDSIAQRYAAQAKSCTPGFIFKALDIINECDVNYRTAKNKRLLVEIMLIKLSQILVPSVTPTEGEKKIKPLVAPAESQQTAPQSNTNISPKSAAPITQSTLTSTAQAARATRNGEERKATIANVSKPTSISISMPERKAHSNEQQQVNNTTEAGGSYENLPIEPNRLLEIWMNFGEEQKRRNPRLASIFLTHKPQVIDEKTFVVELNNETQIKELNLSKTEFMPYLFAKANNNQLVMETKIGTDMKQSRAFTSEDKYEVMLKANPALKDLKQILNLQLD